MDTPATSTAPERYYRMPPVGMSETLVRIGANRISQFTVRCGSASCWFVGHGGSRDDAQFTLDEHTCPTPPIRNQLPTGRSTLEKLWDEMDDVTAALIEKRKYNNMQGEMLKGYCMGIAFNLSMVTHPYFRTMQEISREAGARYKMAKGKIPWRETPSYKYNPMPTVEPNVIKTEPAVKRAPAKRLPAKKAGPKITLSADKISAIKAGRGSGMFTDQDLADMYSVSVAEVIAVCS